MFQNIERVWLLGGALKTSRLRVERKDGLMLVDEDKGGRLPWEHTKDHGDGDLRMASSLRGLVPRTFLLWWNGGRGERQAETSQVIWKPEDPRFYFVGSEKP